MPKRALSEASGLIEQLQAEATGLPKNTMAFMRLFILTVGVFNIASAACAFVASFGSGPITAGDVAVPLLIGLSLTALQLSDYIRRTNPVTPSGGMRPDPERAGRD